MYNKSFAVIGGDLRQAHLANRLSAKGHKVTALLLDKNVELSSKVSQAASVGCISPCDVVVFGLPMCAEDMSINAPYSNREITLEECFKHINADAIVMGGRITPEIKKLAEKHGIDIIDYLQREEMAVLNAVPTAEGALAIAMEEMPTTIFGLRVLVTGFGRISKVLVKILVAMGAEVTVAARKYSDLAWIKIYGAKPVHISALEDVATSADVIFNTVPAMVLDDGVLSKLSRDCLVIDLASKPGGVDFNMARRLGIKVVWALSLPGKVAPITAGEIIKDTVLNIADERGQ